MPLGNGNFLKATIYQNNTSCNLQSSNKIGTSSKKARVARNSRLKGVVPSSNAFSPMPAIKGQGKYAVLTIPPRLAAWPVASTTWGVG